MATSGPALDRLGVKTSRKSFMHALRFVALTLAFWSCYAGANLVYVEAVGRNAGYWDLWLLRAHDILGGQILLVLVLLVALPLVGYRRVDILFIALPLYNIFFLLRTFWRLASLPERYWSRRAPLPLT